MAKIDGKVHLLKFQEELKTMFGLYTEGSENAATTERKIQELTDELNFMNEQIASKNRNLDETTSQKKSLHSSIEEGFSKVEVLREAEKKNRARIAEFYGEYHCAPPTSIYPLCPSAFILPPFALFC